MVKEERLSLQGAAPAVAAIGSLRADDGVMGQSGCIYFYIIFVGSSLKMISNRRELPNVFD